MPIVQPGQISLPQFQPQTPGPNFGERLFGGVSSGIAGVLMAMQQQKENQYQEQQMAQQAQYYSMLSQQAAAQVAAQAQVGGAMGAALGLNQPQPPVQMSRGNQTQAMGAPASPPMSPVAMSSGGAQGQPGVFQEVLSGAVQGMGGAPGVQQIFAGVNPENMGAAVEGVQAVRQLTAPSKSTEPAPTDDQRNFATWAQLQGVDLNDPAQRQQAALVYQRMIGGAAPGPSTVINNIPNKGASRFSEKLGENNADQVTEVDKQSRVVSQAFPILDESYRLVGKAYTGLGATAKLNAARIAIAMGVPEEMTKVADTQTLEKLSGEQVMAYIQSRAAGPGILSDRDMEFLQINAGRDLSKDPAALKRTFRINMGALLMKNLDAMDYIREQMKAYPENARQLQASLEAIERRNRPVWKRYAEIVQLENKAAPRHPENPY
jgi:hypothetical protein